VYSFVDLITPATCAYCFVRLYHISSNLRIPKSLPRLRNNLRGIDVCHLVHITQQSYGVIAYMTRGKTLQRDAGAPNIIMMGSGANYPRHIGDSMHSNVQPHNSSMTVPGLQSRYSTTIDRLTNHLYRGGRSFALVLQDAASPLYRVQGRQTGRHSHEGSDVSIRRT